MRLGVNSLPSKAPVKRRASTKTTAPPRMASAPSAVSREASINARA